MEFWSCDFETTTNPDDCRVWAWCAVNIYDTTQIESGIYINDFIKWLSKSNKTIYFHNLAFDGEFLMTHLFRSGFEHRRDNKKLGQKQFKTLISDEGLVYSIKIKFLSYSTTVYDSLKIIPLKVEKIPSAFGLEQSKGEIDYTKPRPIGYQPDENEWDYIFHDCLIVAQALYIMREQGLVKMTQASNALADYKAMKGNDVFNNMFPQLNSEVDSFCRRAYKGGFVYLNPLHADTEIAGGSVYDVNSLYPAMMLKHLPYGLPQYFSGQYQEDEGFPLYIQGLICNFEIKPGKLPTIQLKHTSRFSATEYLTSSEGDDVYLCLTNIDLKLFFEHYDVYDIEWMGGYKFRSYEHLFTDYIEKWSQVKIEAAKTGNMGMRQIAKLMLNSLYGKFGTNPISGVKWPYYDQEQERIRYMTGEAEHRKSLYVPVAAFITSYARETTIRAAQSCGNQFIYADTDSIHVTKYCNPPIEIHPTKLGAWKKEFVFSRGKYLHSKCYIELGHDPEKDEEDKLKITVAGMPPGCYSQVNFDTFKYGQEFSGKLVTKRVSGGIVLLPTTYKIKIK